MIPKRAGITTVSSRAGLSPGGQAKSADTRAPSLWLSNADHARVAALTLPLAIGTLAFVVRLSVGPHAYDDAYITFRYARNLARGLGMVYNPGERVLGTTTPLWTVILAAFYRLGLHDLPSLALVLSAVADGVTAFLIVQVARRLSWSDAWAMWLAALFAFCSLSLCFAAGGMESSLFTALAFGALISVDRPRLAAVLASLAILCRPEGVIVAALLFFGQWSRQRRVRPDCVVLTALMLAPWIVFSTAVYGSPISESVVVKASHYAPSLTTNLQWLVANLGAPGFDEPLLESSPLVTFISTLVGLGIIVCLIRSRRALATLLRRDPGLLPFVSFAPLLALLLVVEGFKSSHIFPWYLVPFVPFALFGLAGAVRLGMSRSRRLGILLVAGLSVWTLLGLNLGRQPDGGAFSAFRVNLGRERAYREAARFLVPRLPATAVVAAPEIGTLGYFSSFRILDTAGLISPAAERYYPLPAGYPRDITLPPNLIREELPDAIVVLSKFLPPQLQDAVWFHTQYVTAVKIALGKGPNSTVYVYIRRGDKA